MQEAVVADEDTDVISVPLVVAKVHQQDVTLLVQLIGDRSADVLPLLIERLELWGVPFAVPATRPRWQLNA